jgi:hypothetical protein
VDRIEVQTGAIDEFRWRRIAGLVERVKLKMLVKGFDRWARIAFDREATQSTRYIESPRSGDEVAIGRLSLVVRRQKNIFAAASLIRTSNAHIDDVPHPVVVCETENPGRNFHDHRASFEIKRRPKRRGLRIWG